MIPVTITRGTRSRYEAGTFQIKAQHFHYTSTAAGTMKMQECSNSNIPTISDKRKLICS
jgi:hypothetical protein